MQCLPQAQHRHCTSLRNVSTNINAKSIKKMKFTNLFLLVNFVLFVSCNNKSNELRHNIELLKEENTVLKDSINGLNVKLAKSLKMKTNFANKISKVNNINTIEGYFQYFDYLPEYKVYIKSNTMNNKILVYKGTDPDFKIQYKPESVNETVIEITAEYHFNDKIVLLYSELPIKFN